LLLIVGLCHWTLKNLVVGDLPSLLLARSEKQEREREREREREGEREREREKEF